MNQERILKIAAAICVLLLAISAFWVFGARRSSLPDYGSSPQFKLTSQDGREFDSARMRGKVWVASFVYSTCKTSCPMLGVQMKRLYASVPDGEAFALASFSVDPERDTPERLARYAKDLGVGDSRWVFLTGNKAAMKTLITSGFKLPAEPGVVTGDNEILHSSKLVLMDASGKIRGYYDGTLGESVEQIKAAAKQLMHESRRG